LLKKLQIQQALNRTVITEPVALTLNVFFGIIFAESVPEVDRQGNLSKSVLNPGLNLNLNPDKSSLNR